MALVRTLKSFYWNRSRRLALERLPRGRKPTSILRALRGAEAPLFHGTARVCEFFRAGDAVPFQIESQSESQSQSFRAYFAVTSMTWISGYWWFHCAEMLSKVRRKGWLCPGASGETVRSTASG